jgi:hypothetical protein
MILINKIENHIEVNKKILSLIEKIPINKLTNKFEDVTHTDYSLPKDFKMEYIQYFISIIEPYLNKDLKKHRAISMEIGRIWFQQYEKNSFHEWHVHPECHFTNIYFVELPSQELVTEILDHEKLSISEGDLITFPAFWYHRSPINLSSKRKTIISFNSNIKGFAG